MYSAAPADWATRTGIYLLNFNRDKAKVVDHQLIIRDNCNKENRPYI